MSRKMDNRRMTVMRMMREGYKSTEIAAACGAGTATIGRDLAWLRKGNNAAELAERCAPDIRKPHEVRSAIAARHIETTIKPEVVVNMTAGPKGPNARARAMEDAARLWRLHVPDPLVALKAFRVDPSLLSDWLAEGRRQILAGSTDGWEAALYLARAGAFTDSLTGDDGRPGILSTLHALMGQTDEPRIAFAAAKLLHEQGAMRQYFVKPIEVRVSAEVPGEAIEGAGESSGLAAALGRIGADSA